MSATRLRRPRPSAVAVCRRNADCRFSAAHLPIPAACSLPVAKPTFAGALCAYRDKGRKSQKKVG